MGMFGAKAQQEPQTGSAGLSIIAVGMTVMGNIESNGTVKVEGRVDGDVVTRQQLLVARGGVVEGDVEAREVVVGGTIHGAIRAQERIEVQSGAEVNGDVVTRRIAVAEGASLNGQVRMGDAAATKASSATEAPRPAEPTGQGTGSSGPPIGRQSVPVARVAVPPRVSSPDRSI